MTTTESLSRPITDASGRSGAPLCALMTTFNRRETTLTCLRALEVSARQARIPIAAIIVDDASRDGTADAVRSGFDWATVLEGGGDLYWSRGMSRAFDAAVAKGYSYFLWLNDDTCLTADALRRLLDCEGRLSQARSRAIIVVGATEDAITKVPTYGGEKSASRWRPLRLSLIVPSIVEQRCDSMTGNIVLVSVEAVARTGSIDGAFEHAMGDTDYALRARAAGVDIWLAPGIFGTCSENDVRGTYRDETLPLRVRWRLMLSRKGLPWRSWLRLCSRHGGALWPLAFAWPYAKLVGRTVLTRRTTG